jgi:hypothetical protein
MVPDSGRSLVRVRSTRCPAGSKIRQKLNRTFLTLPADITTLYMDNFAVFSRQRLEACGRR